MRLHIATIDLTKDKATGEREDPETRIGRQLCLGVRSIL